MGGVSIGVRGPRRINASRYLADRVPPSQAKRSWGSMTMLDAST